MYKIMFGAFNLFIYLFFILINFFLFAFFHIIIIIIIIINRFVQLKVPSPLFPFQREYSYFKMSKSF